MQARVPWRVIWFLIIVFLIFQPSVASAADDWVDAGNAEWDKGNFEGALNAYEKAIAQDQNNVAAWSNKGGALNNLGRFTEGLAASEKALTLDPRYAMAWNNKGIALWRMYRLDEALVAFERAIVLNQQLIDAWSNKAGVLNDLKRYDEGLAASEKALTLNQRHANSWINKGIALAGLRRFDEALVAYDRALALQPESALAWNNKAAALEELQRYEDALPTSERAIALDPNLASAWNNKGVALFHLGRLEDSLAALDKAVALDPNFALAWSNRGDTLQKMGRSDDAFESYRKAQELDASLPTRTLESPGMDGGATGYLVFTIFAISLAAIVLFYRQRPSRPGPVTEEMAIKRDQPLPPAIAVQVLPRSPPSSGTEYDVFLSHAREDAGIADALCWALEPRGIRCWIPSRDLTPGSMEGEAIMEAIGRSRMMVVILSAAAVRSGFVVRDLNAAVSRRMRILPVVTGDVHLPDSLDYLIGGIPGVQLGTVPDEDELANLVTTVQTQLAEGDGSGTGKNGGTWH